MGMLFEEKQKRKWSRRTVNEASQSEKKAENPDGKIDDLAENLMQTMRRKKSCKGEAFRGEKLYSSSANDEVIYHILHDTGEEFSNKQKMHTFYVLHASVMRFW